MIPRARVIRLHAVFSVITVTLLTRLAIFVYFLRVRPDIFAWNVNECGMIGAALVHGHGFSGGFHDYSGATSWFAPAYPLILSGLFRLFGTQTFASAVAAYFLQIFFAIATAVLIVKIGTRLCTATTALFAGLIWGLTPQAALPEFVLADTTLATMSMCLAIFLTVNLSPDSRKLQWFLCGIAWGLAGLASPATLAPVPLMLIYLYKKNSTHHWKTVVLVVALCLMLAPWIIRDMRIFHRWVPVRDNGLAEIYFANVGYDENPSGLSMEYQRLGEGRFVSMIERKLLLYVSTQPLKFVKDTMVRAYRFWTVPEGLFGWSAVVSFVSWLGLLRLTRKSWLDSLPFLGVMGIYPIIYYLSVTFSRYRQPVEPFLYILGTHAVMNVVASMGKWRQRNISGEADLSAQNLAELLR